jgi:uncharacterized protein YqhQ
MAEPKSHIGGQAVIEGVMMRGKRHWVVAVRKPDDQIVLHSRAINSLAGRFPFFNWIVFRGVAALVESLTIGMQALSFSAQQSLEEEEEMSGWQMSLMMALAVALALTLIIVLPSFLARFLDAYFTNSVLFNIVEGLIRIGIFFGYLLAISWAKDVNRLFQYHGAEHKVIHAYEKEGHLSVQAAQKYSPLHLRCGTAFLLIVMVVLVLVFAFLGRPSLELRIFSRLVAVPLIAGISYEIIKLASKYEGLWLVRTVMAPGLWLQRMTTREPSEDQLEVAIGSLQKLLELEGIEDKDDVGATMA